MMPESDMSIWSLNNRWMSDIIKIQEDESTFWLETKIGAGMDN